MEAIIIGIMCGYVGYIIGREHEKNKSIKNTLKAIKTREQL